jgi:hemicentin
VDGEADCDNKNPYNGNFISMTPCTGRATTSCAWGAWSSWGSCSATCGGGSQGATRNVDQQATNGGQECKGSKKRSQECGMKECPTDCSWSAWSSWSSCSATCGGGSQSATRNVDQQATNGGHQCKCSKKK